MNRSDLRDLVIERSGGRCEWPRCQADGREQAHLHSIGMGGRASADTIDNVAWLCSDHARMSDGLRGSGGRPQYRQSHIDLFTASPPDFTRNSPTYWFPELVLQHLERFRMAYERAEALTRLIKEKQ